MRSDDSSWGLGVQPLQSRCLPFGSCCCVGGRLMPQSLSSALRCCSGKGHPIATPETHPGHPGNGQHPHLLPSNDKGGQRGSEACVPMCMPSLPTPFWVGHHALGYETHPAYSCCPTTDLKASSMKVVLYGPSPRVMAAPGEAGRHDGLWLAGRVHQVFRTSGSFIRDRQGHPGLPWSLRRGMGKARTAPHPLRLLLLPELKRKALPAATLALCLFPIPSLLVPGSSLSPLACLLVPRARSYPYPPHPEHPPWGDPVWGCSECQCPASSLCPCPHFLSL